MGGSVLGEADVGYGPAPYLIANELREVADILDAIPAFELVERLDAERMNDEGIYLGDGLKTAMIATGSQRSICDWCSSFGRQRKPATRCCFI